MNWRRGIFRLWLAASAVWITIVVVSGYGHFQLMYGLGDPHAPGILYAVGFIALGPVILTLVLGIIFNWIIKGFASRQ